MPTYRKPDISAMDTSVTQGPVNTIPLQGRDPTPRKTAPNPLLDIEPHHYFVYGVHHEFFDVMPVEWDEEGTPTKFEPLPVLRTFRFTPGVGGVKYIKGENDGDPELMLSSAVKKGYRLIPEDTEVEAFGERRRGYVHTFDGKRGPANLPVWCRPYVLGSAVYFENDRVGFAKFQRWAFTELLSGVFDPNIKKLLTSRLRSSWNSAKVRANSSPTAAAILETMTRRLQALEPARVRRATP